MFFALRRCITLIVLLLSTAVLPAQDEYLQIVTEQDEDGTYRFYAESSHIVPLWLKVYFKKLNNLEASETIPFFTAIEPGQSEVFLFSLSPVEENKSYGYRMVYSYSRGNPETADHDESYRYLFPFKHGSKHRITQGHNGKFTHFDENQYALDFDLDTGTAIYAARSGRVVEVKEDSNYGGPGAQYSKHANYILIYHDDGSFGNYVHLRQNGADVEAGDYVEAGDFLGYSGNTGRSSGPHLHFDVRLPTFSGGMQSIPVRFLNYDGAVIDPEENRFYYAYHPGKPEFEAVFGRDLKNSDYRDYAEAAEADGKISLRTEELDFTYIVFISNGVDRRLELTVDADLNNMSSTVPLPAQIEIPPLTEIFLTLLRPADESSRWGYSFSVKYRK
jgi:murein DD-endopeptidase MepM/ murein hydrolase activator NlpD